MFFNILEELIRVFLTITIYNWLKSAHNKYWNSYKNNCPNDTIDKATMTNPIVKNNQNDDQQQRH